MERLVNLALLTLCFLSACELTEGGCGNNRNVPCLSDEDCSGSRYFCLEQADGTGRCTRCNCKNITQCYVYGSELRCNCGMLYTGEHCECGVCHCDQHPSCEHGWRKIHDKCVRLFTQDQSWYKANAMCEVFGDGTGSLVTIRNHDTNDLLNFINNGVQGDFWIGLYYQNNNWLWASEEFSSFFKWDQAPIGDLSGQCAYMRLDDEGDGLWYHDACSSTRNYICEYQIFVGEF